MTLSNCNTDHSRKTPMNSPHSLLRKHPMRTVQTTALLLSLALAPQGCASSTPRAETPADLEQRVVRTSPVMQHARVLAGPHAFLSAPVTSFGAAAWGEHLYVLGGYRGESHHYTAEGQSASLGRLHVATGAWEELAGLERGLQSAALVAHEGTLIRVGGLHAQHSPDDAADAADRLRSTDEVARYDIASGRWASLPPLPTPRSSHMAAVLDGVLYVAGGWDLDHDPATARWATTVEALDLRNTDAGWRSIDAPFQLRGVGVAAASGQLVVVGGMDPIGVPQRVTHLFDPSDASWTRGPELPASPFGAAAAAVGSEVVVTGMDGVVHVLTPGEATWRSAGSVLFPRFFHQNVAANGQVFSIGGTAGMDVNDRIPHVERVWPAPAPVLLTVDYTGPTKNRQGMVIVDDWLYLFGGNTSHGQHDFAPENFSHDARRLHLPTLRWEPLAPYPENRQTMAVIATDDTHFVSVGGFGIPDAGGEAVAHNESFVYDVTAGTWSPAPALGLGRTQFALTRAPSGELLVMGGLNYDPSRAGMAAFQHLTTVEQRAVDGTAFTDAGFALPRVRRAFGGEALGERFFMVGGMRDNFQLVSECEVLSFTTRDFTPMACPSETRLSPQLVALGERLVLVGGSVVSGQDATSTRAIEVYDPATDTWTTSELTLPFESTHVRAFPYRDRVVVVTTHDAPDGQLRVFLFTP
jgi:N-acetylneuraminic acid mutarotase